MHLSFPYPTLSCSTYPPQLSSHHWCTLFLSSLESARGKFSTSDFSLRRKEIMVDRIEKGIGCSSTSTGEDICTTWRPKCERGRKQKEVHVKLWCVSLYRVVYTAIYICMGTCDATTSSRAVKNAAFLSTVSLDRFSRPFLSSVHRCFRLIYYDEGGLHMEEYCCYIIVIIV